MSELLDEARKRAQIEPVAKTSDEKQEALRIEEVQKTTNEAKLKASSLVRGLAEYLKTFLEELKIKGFNITVTEIEGSPFASQYISTPDYQEPTPSGFEYGTRLELKFEKDGKSFTMTFLPQRIGGIRRGDWENMRSKKTGFAIAIEAAGQQLNLKKFSEEYLYKHKRKEFENYDDCIAVLKEGLIQFVQVNKLY